MFMSLCVCLCLSVCVYPSVYYCLSSLLTSHVSTTQRRCTWLPKWIPLSALLFCSSIKQTSMLPTRWDVTSFLFRDCSIDKACVGCSMGAHHCSQRWTREPCKLCAHCWMLAPAWTLSPARSACLVMLMTCVALTCLSSCSLAIQLYTMLSSKETSRSSLSCSSVVLILPARTRCHSCTRHQFLRNS